MRRCPDCGFRANDTVCPLCGVRMSFQGLPLNTHAHTQRGERCVLPNQTQRRQPPLNDTKKHEGAQSKLSSYFITIGVIILLSILRSCLG